jgi:hypothetical protein
MENKDFDFSFIASGLTVEQAEKIWKEIVAAIEAGGGETNGGFGEAQEVKNET